MDSRNPKSAPDDDAPKFRAVLPPELDGLPDEPFVQLDLDAFDRWAKTGEGDPWSQGE